MGFLAKIVGMGQEKEVSIATFVVGDEEYAITLDHLTEILFDYKIDYLPHLGKNPVGTTTFPKKKGKSIPVIDLAALLDLPARRDKRYLLIVEEVNLQMGFLIDSSTTVMKISKERIHPLANVFSETEKSYLDGIVQVDSRLIGLIRPVKAVEILAPEATTATKRS